MPWTPSLSAGARLEVALAAEAEAVCAALLAALLTLAAALEAEAEMLLRAEEADEEADATAPVLVMVLLAPLAVMGVVPLAAAVLEQPAVAGCQSRKRGVSRSHWTDRNEREQQIMRDGDDTRDP
jgi:hypothetical protein